MNVLEETKFLISKYKIRANKSLGQNFLIDEAAINMIIDGAKIEKDDLIIEIGPGLGTMTKYLLEKAKKVVCVELDKNMIRILKDRFIAYNNFRLINDDILLTDINKIIKEEKENSEIKNVKVVANLPYYITTPIIMKLLESNLNIDSITVMVQKEVAERLIETPGGKNTGAITYTVYYYAESTKIAEVQKECFIPMPEVTSEVINLKLRKEPVVDVKNEKLFFNIIKSGFLHKRKTFLNSLVNAKIGKNKEEILEALKRANLEENIRAEKMTIEDFARIATFL